MSRTTASPFKRELLEQERNTAVVNALQPRLVDLIDLSLQLKQAHWAVIGVQFQPVHEQLDGILDDVREASDDVAERIATLGVAPDGRAKTVAESSNLGEIGGDFTPVGETVSSVADRLKTTIDGLRDSIEVLGDLDPISEDLLIGVTAPLEKHLWMLQAQEQ